MDRRLLFLVQYIWSGTTMRTFKLRILSTKSKSNRSAATSHSSIHLVHLSTEGFYYIGHLNGRTCQVFLGSLFLHELCPYMTLNTSHVCIGYPVFKAGKN